MFNLLMMMTYSLQVEERSVTSLQRWKAHELEAWAVAHDAHNPSVVYSGGDDSVFQGWDIRQGVEQPMFRDRQ